MMRLIIMLRQCGNARTCTYFAVGNGVRESIYKGFTLLTLNGMALGSTLHRPLTDVRGSGINKRADELMTFAWKLALAVAAILSLTRAAVCATPALGSADFHPSPEHPFGWRGDGTGRFPGATPVTEWS